LLELRLPASPRISLDSATVPLAEFEIAMTAAVLLDEVDFRRQPSALGRGEALARYRRLREVGKRHHSNVLDFLSKDAILQQARRLGLADGKTLLVDSLDELTLAFDLAIYTAPVGRSRAIDRYSNSTNLARGSDDAVVLAAMRDARFAILVARRRHPSAGLIVTDLFREVDLWLVDEGLETSMPDGAAFATRYYVTEPFIMTAGVCLPIDRSALASAIESAPQLIRKSPVDAIQDRRFAESVYRGAIEDGTAANVQWRDTPDADGDA
jgi:hypothetical protein